MKIPGAVLGRRIVLVGACGFLLVLAIASAVCGHGDPATPAALHYGTQFPNASAVGGLPTLNVLTCGAKGDGVTNDQPAIKACDAQAAAAGGAIIYFPRGTYLMNQDGGNTYELNITCSNCTYLGTPNGGSTILSQVGLPGGSGGSVAIFKLDQRTNVTFRDLVVSGNWGNAVATVAIASNNQAATGTINVASTAAFPASGPYSLVVVDTVAGGEAIACTGKTATSFTTCTGGTGTIFYNNKIGLVDGNTGINQGAQSDPKNYGIMIRGSSHITIDHTVVQQTYGDCIWLGGSSTDSTVVAQDVKILNSTCDMPARDGIALGGPSKDVYVDNFRATNVFAQAFDTEPPNSYARNVNVDHSLIGNWWNPGASYRHGNSPMSIQGGQDSLQAPTNHARNYRITNSQIDGSVIISDAVDVVFAHNRVVEDWTGQAQAPLYLFGYDNDITIDDNYIYTRTAANGGGSGAGILLLTQGGGVVGEPTGVRITNNKIYVRNGATGINVSGSMASPALDGGTMTSINASTTIASASNTVSLKTATTVNVASTTGFPNHGTLNVTTTLGPQPVIYTGVTSTSFTGVSCSCGGAMATGGAVQALVVTDSTKSWTTDQWFGFQVRAGAARAVVVSNTATQLSLANASGDVANAWSLPFGDYTPDPSGTSAYAITIPTGTVEVGGNRIDGQDDGAGPSGVGIYTDPGNTTSAPQDRLWIHDNVLRDVTGPGVQIHSRGGNPYTWLELTHNKAYDDQATPTCTSAISFDTSPVPNFTTLVMRDNLNGDGVASNTVGLTTGTWLEGGGAEPIYAGYGVPTMAAPQGSTYKRRDGSIGSTLYVKETGSGTSGWDAAGTSAAQPPSYVSELGLVGASGDPALASGAGATTGGVLYMTQLQAFSASFSKVILNVALAQVGATHVYVGIYNADGTQTANMSTAGVDAASSLLSTGMKTITLTNPVSDISAGANIYVVVLVVGASQQPQLNTFPATIANGALNPASASLRAATSGSALTALPGSITISGTSSLASLRWVGIQ